MSWNNELPPEILKIIDKTVIALEKKCVPCQVVIKRVITDKKMMDEDEVVKHTTTALKKLAKYIYQRGIVDAIKASDREKEYLQMKAIETVTHFECRIITPEGPVD